MARIEPAIDKGALLQLYSAMWGPMYEAVLNILGSTGTILPTGDPKHGQPNANTFATVGGEQVTFTWSETPLSFDTPLDLTDPASFQGITPIVEFNGSDEEADTPDAAFWTRDDTSSEKMTIGFWVNVTDTAGIRTLLGKHDATSGVEAREWLFHINASDFLTLQISDESANVAATRVSDAAINMGVWTFLVCTYDGGGGATAADGITLYQDGALFASTATNNGSYVGMEDLATVVTLGHFTGSGGTASSFFSGKMAGGPMGKFFTHKELSADEVLRLYELGRRALGL